jgi:diguanylate cyclase (GGDEF)-like protein/PAS domain S-box-containing protein
MEGDRQSRDQIQVRMENARALVAADGASVFCTDARCLPCPPPPELAAVGVPSEPPGWLSEKLPIPEVARCLNAMREAEQEGLGTVDIVDNDSIELRVTVVNLLESYDVYVWVVTERAVSPAGVWAGGISKRIRHFACHRDEVASFVWVADEVETFLGWTPTDLVGRTALDFMHPDDAARAIDVWVDVLENAPISHSRSRWRTKTGEWRWVEVTNDNRLDELGRVESQIIDIHDEMEAAAQARIGQQGFTTLTEALPIGVVQLDAAGSVVYVNTALRELACGLETDGESTEVFAAVSSRDQAPLGDAVSRAIDGEPGNVVVRFRRYDGAERTMEVRIRPLVVDGAKAGAIATFEDITERHQLQDELRRLADTDALTGLANRRRVLEELTDTLTADQGLGQLVLLFIDLDGFKLLNDVSGHEAGDRYLFEFAQRLSSLLGRRGLAGRFGGDEFVAICPGMTADDAVRLAVRLLESSPQMRESDPVSANPVCSIGIVVNDGSDDMTADQLLARSDVAMYSAKRDGGGRWALYDPEMGAAVTR